MRTKREVHSVDIPRKDLMNQSVTTLRKWLCAWCDAKLDYARRYGCMSKEVATQKVCNFSGNGRLYKEHPQGKGREK